MAEIGVGNFIGGVAATLPFPGPPVAGTSEVDTLTIGGAPTAGAGSGFTLVFAGATTPLILWSATNATLLANIQAALDGLSSGGVNAIVAAAVSLTAGVGTISLTLSGNLANRAVTPISVGTNAMTGASPTAAVAQTTPGVNATFRGTNNGTLVKDTVNGIAYINTGTATSPAWTKIGTQV